MKFSFFTALLFSIAWMSFEVAADDRTPSVCCLKTSNTRIPVEKIVRYEIQEAPPCPTRAIRFHTKKNKGICSDPDDTWAKRAMTIVDKRTTTPSQQPTKCYTSTTNNVTTANKPPVTEPKTTMSTAEPTTVTKITSRQTTSTSTTLSTTERTIKTSAQMTSTSTTEPTTVKRIKTSRQTTITSTTEPTTVRIIKNPGQNMDNSRTTTQTISDDPTSSLNTATTCGTGEPTTTATKTTSRVTSTTPAKRTKPSPIKMKLLKKKSKNVLRKYQMRSHKKTKE